MEKKKIKKNTIKYKKKNTTHKQKNNKTTPTHTWNSTKNNKLMADFRIQNRQ